MITLVSYPKGWGQPSLSPFCVKAIYMLNLSGLPWQLVETHDPRSFPKGKLPAIEVDGQTIGDSDAIRAHIAKQGRDLDAHLSPTERADARAYQHMAESHLYFQVVWDRWANDQVWPEVKRSYFGTIPAIIRGFVTHKLRRDALQGLRFMGLGRDSEDERLAKIEQDLQALSTRLKGHAFLFGDTPCTADISMSSMLAAAKTTPVPTALSNRIGSDEVLCDYIARVAEYCAPAP